MTTHILRFESVHWVSLKFSTTGICHSGVWNPRKRDSNQIIIPEKQIPAAATVQPGRRNTIQVSLDYRQNIDYILAHM